MGCLICKTSGSSSSYVGVPHVDMYHSLRLTPSASRGGIFHLFNSMPPTGAKTTRTERRISPSLMPIVWEKAPELSENLYHRYNAKQIVSNLFFWHHSRGHACSPSRQLLVFCRVQGKMFDWQWQLTLDNYMLACLVKKTACDWCQTSDIKCQVFLCLSCSIHLWSKSEMKVEFAAKKARSMFYNLFLVAPFGSGNLSPQSNHIR